MTGQVERHRMPSAVDSREVVQDGRPMPTVEAETVKEHQRRPTVRDTDLISGKNAEPGGKNLCIPH